MSNQNINLLSSPEDGLILNPLVNATALDDSITTIVDRTETLYTVIEALLCVETVEIKEGTISNYFWQMQGNIDLLDKHLEAYLSDDDYSMVGFLTATIRRLCADVICDYCSAKAPPLSLEDKSIVREKAVSISYQLEVIKGLLKGMQCREAKQ